MSPVTGFQRHISVSEKTAKRLRKIQKQITTKPNQFDMAMWARGRSACGTVCCIGGQAIINEGIQTPREVENDPGRTTLSDLRKSVREAIVAGYTGFRSVSGYNPERASFVYTEALALGALRINAEQAQKLFYTSQWPKAFREAYGIDADGDQLPNISAVLRAHVAAARIEHFITTGE